MILMLLQKFLFFSVFKLFQEQARELVNIHRKLKEKKITIGKRSLSSQPTPPPTPPQLDMQFIDLEVRSFII